MSKRTDRRHANRRPFWMHRATEAQQSPEADTAYQYDYARTAIHHIPFAQQRDDEWRALAATVAAFNGRFVGVDSASAAVPGTQPGVGAIEPSGRLASPERRFKSRMAPIEQVTAAYDTARKYLRRIADGAEQVQQWQELASELATFNQRFTRDRTRT
jgi:hypothetical protein